MAWKLSIKGNFFYAEEQGGTNLCHEYPQIQCRFGKKYNDSTKYTFYQNHNGIVIDRLENLEWTEFLDSTGTPFASQLAFESWCNENLGGIGSAGSSTTTVELDLLKSELIPIISSNTQYYLQEKTVVDNTTGVETVAQIFYDSNLSIVATPLSYEIGTKKSVDSEFVKTYYQVGSTILEGYSRLENGIQKIYNLNFSEVIGATAVQEPEKSVSISNQLTVGSVNNHFEMLAGNSQTFSGYKCISFMVKGDCTLTIDGVTINYEDGDSFSFSSENVLVNSITINQITNKTNILTLK